MKKRKLRKPRWTYFMPTGECTARCDEDYGYRSVRIAGYPTKLAKVEQLAKWFTAAAAWLREQEGEK